uniref:Cullin domain-containing protein n=1 Tax=Meloidogyne hapla TaxID=6305 RepID=A0A1I8BBJ4_MELHA
MLFKDHLNVLVRSNELLAQIQEKLEILYSESREDEDFLRVIHKIVRTYCGDLVHKEQASVSFSHRILPNLYAIQEDGIQYYDRYSSGHIPQPQIAQQRPTDVSGSDIKRDKSNGRTVCRVGAYLAMCKVIRMNLLRSQSKKYRDVISISTKKQHEAKTLRALVRYYSTASARSLNESKIDR